MAEKLNSKDRQVLLVTDAADPKALKVVAGMDKNGKPKTVNPGSDLADFLNIDKNGNALENFFKKFIEQSKNPTHTGFFVMSVETLDKLIKIQPLDEKALEPYRVDPKRFLDERQAQTQAQGDAPAQKTVFQPIDESKINWAQGESMGVNRQALEDAGQLKAMLYGHKSPALNNLTFTMEGVTFDTQARLSLKEMPDGTYNFQPHCYLKAPELEKAFLGATLSDKDKENLLANGNAGRVIELEPTPGQKVPALVSLDKITNRLEAVPVEKLNLPQSLKGVEFTPEQLKDLKEGKQVLVEGMTSKNTMGTDNPKKFDAYIQFNAAKGSFDFNYDGLNKREQKREQTQAPDGEAKNGVRIPAKLLGADLTEKQQADLRADKTIYVTGMTDKEGQPFNAYVKVDHEKGKLGFFKWNPDKAKTVTPDNAAKTQVAVNSEGKTNEATKNVKEPLKKGQTQPTEPQQKKINKSKGVKM